MLRSVSAPLVVVAGLAWLSIGLLAGALVGGALQAGVPAGDPLRAALVLVALLVGVAIALIGLSITMWFVRRRAPAPSTRGSVPPNTLRGDATQRPRSRFGRTLSPVLPNRTKARGGPGAARSGSPGGPPPPPSSWSSPRAPGGVPPADSGAWAWTPGRQAGTVRPRAPIPGAQLIGSTRSTGRSAPIPQPATILPAVLSLVAGTVLAVQQASSGTIDAAGWIIFAALLLASGAVAAGGPPTARRRLPLGVLAAVPVVLVCIAAVGDGVLSAPSALLYAIAAYVGATLMIGVGASLVGGARRLR